MKNKNRIKEAKKANQISKEKANKNKYINKDLFLTATAFFICTLGIVISFWVLG